MPVQKTSKSSNGKKGAAMKSGTEKAVPPRKKKAANGNGTHAEPRTTEVQLDHTAVARRAWEIWQSEGCPDGREVEHWLQAEKELNASLSL